MFRPGNLISQRRGGPLLVSVLSIKRTPPKGGVLIVILQKPPTTSFPNMGGTTVSSDTLSANLHGHAFRRIGSEIFYSIGYIISCLLTLDNPTSLKPTN